MTILKNPPLTSKRLRDSARGQDCTLRLACCNHNPETTVLAHLPVPGFKGVGMKVPDNLSAFACLACHDAIDRRRHDVEWDYRDLLRALGETQAIWIQQGLLRVGR